MPSMMANVRGSLRLKTDPLPASEVISTLPRSFSMFLRTTSMPTPRPEMSDTTATVEKPAWKIMSQTWLSDSSAGS